MSTDQLKYKYLVAWRSYGWEKMSTINWHDKTSVETMDQQDSPAIEANFQRNNRVQITNAMQDDQSRRWWILTELSMIYKFPMAIIDAIWEWHELEQMVNARSCFRQSMLMPVLKKSVNVFWSFQRYEQDQQRQEHQWLSEQSISIPLTMSKFSSIKKTVAIIEADIRRLIITAKQWFDGVRQHRNQSAMFSLSTGMSIVESRKLPIVQPIRQYSIQSWTAKWYSIVKYQRQLYSNNTNDNSTRNSNKNK